MTTFAVLVFLLYSACFVSSQLPAAGGGRFLIESAANTGLVLDVSGASTANGAGLIVFNRNGNRNQQFQFGGASTIVNVNSGLVLDISGGAASGRRLIQYRYNGGSNQQFFLVATSSSRSNYDVTIRVGSSTSNLCLDITGANIRSGTAVQAYTCNGGSNQRWRIHFL